MDIDYLEKQLKKRYSVCKRGLTLVDLVREVRRRLSSIFYILCTSGAENELLIQVNIISLNTV